MNKYDYWNRPTSKRKKIDGLVWSYLQSGESNVSVYDALKVAEKNLQEINERLSKDEIRDTFYYVSGGPITEMVIERYGDTDKPYAAITRNRYGSLVLNATNLFIADIDLNLPYYVPKLPYPKEHRLNPVVSQKGLSERQKAAREEELDRIKLYTDHYHEFIGDFIETKTHEQNRILASLDEFHKKYPSLSFRAYETAAGYRVIVTSQSVDTSSSESSEWLEALDSDKLYRRLCKKQECYRARLTPKPWRMLGMSTPYFFLNGGYDLVNWLEQYEEKSTGYGVCRLAASYGDGTVFEEAEKILKVHDQYVFNDEAAELA